MKDIRYGCEYCNASFDLEENDKGKYIVNRIAIKKGERYGEYIARRDYREFYIKCPLCGHRNDVDNEWTYAESSLMDHDFFKYHYWEDVERSKDLPIHSKIWGWIKILTTRDQIIRMKSEHDK